MTAFPMPTGRASVDAAGSTAVYLVPAGPNRFELYSEPSEDVGEPVQQEGFVRRWMHKVSARWRQLVESAQSGPGKSRFARWRDRIVCHLAESIAEQRTLWALRHATTTTARFPANVDRQVARAALDHVLARARQHHGRWLWIDFVLMLITGPVLFFVPGPNVIAYYFLFRVIGHFLSWRGARHAMDRVVWTLEPDQGLAELASLVDVPRAARASRVAAIAARLNLPRLSAFFDRVAVPSS